MKTLYLIRHGHSLHNELFPKLGMQAFRIPEVRGATSHHGLSKIPGGLQVSLGDYHGW